MRILLVLVFSIAVLAPAHAVDVSQPTAVSAVKADVLYWEGEEVIVKEVSGRELRLRVTPETKIEGVAGGRLKTGDKIAAQVNGDGRALSITLQIPDSGTGGIQPGAR